MVVFDAAQRAGLGQVHAHRLRHTAATAMLRAGSPLAEVGQVLRHRSALSTRRSTPRSTGTRWPCWPGPGRSRADGGRVVTGRCVTQLADYLALRRALGYRLARPEKLLDQFLDHLDATARRHAVTVASGAGLGPAARRRRLELVGLPAVGGARVRHLPARPRPGARGARRGPAAAAAAAGQPVPVLRRRDRRADRPPPSTLRTPLRRATFATLIGLLAVTGMRVGEAIGLDRDDLDLTSGRLLVRHGKFDKARELPLHPTTVDALRALPAAAGPVRPADRTPALLVSTAGTRLLYCNVHHTFHRLVRPRRTHPAVGVVPAPHPRPAALPSPSARCSTPTRAGAGRAGPADAAVDLARPRPPGQHLLVPVRLPGADGPRRAAPRTRTWPGRP